MSGATKHGILGTEPKVSGRPAKTCGVIKTFFFFLFYTLIYYPVMTAGALDKIRGTKRPLETIFEQWP